MHRSMKLALVMGISVVVLGLRLSAVAAAEPEWKDLFNGKDLTGWKVYGDEPEEWSVQDGVIHCRGVKHVNWLGTADEYANFELELEYKLAAGGNSGVYIRAPLKGNPSFSGMEIQLLDDNSTSYSKLHPGQHTGSIYDVVPSRFAADQWQKMTILCDHRHVKVTLSGIVIVDANLDDYKDHVEKGDDHEAHPGLLRETGHIGLQNHTGPLDFRNLRIRVLP